MKQIRRPTPEQVEELLAKQVPNRAADPEFPETVWVIEDFMLAFSGPENDFAWSYSVRGAADHPDLKASYHTVAGDHWCNNGQEQKERAKHWLLHGYYPPSEETVRVYSHGVYPPVLH